MSIPISLVQITKNILKDIDDKNRSRREELQNRLGTIYILDIEELKFTLDLMLRGKGAARSIKKTSGYGIFGTVLKNYDDLKTLEPGKFNTYEGLTTKSVNLQRIVDSLDINIFSSSFSYNTQLDKLIKEAKSLAKDRELKALSIISGNLSNEQLGPITKRGSELISLKETLIANSLYNLKESQTKFLFIFKDHNDCRDYHNSLEAQIKEIFIEPIIDNLKQIFKLNANDKKTLTDKINKVDRSLDVAHGGSIGLSAQLFNITRSLGEGAADLRQKAKSMTGLGKIFYELTAKSLESMAKEAIRKFIPLGFNEIPVNINDIVETRVQTFLNHDVDIGTGQLRSEMTVIVSTQGSAFNASQSSMEREISLFLKDKISGLFASITGSPNLIQVIETSLFQRVTKDLVKRKGVRIKGPKNKITKVKASEIVESSTKNIIKSGQTSKAKKGTPVKAKAVRKVTTTPTESPTRLSASPLEMITYINKELPKELDKLMVAPRLETRTGRFAQSVQVRNITQTKQGFPSIDYTYQRDPYQVFEMGIGRFPWATRERDPRPLIDRAIRNIAAEMLKARIYTRRI